MQVGGAGGNSRGADGANHDIGARQRGGAGVGGGGVRMHGAGTVCWRSTRVATNFKFRRRRWWTSVSSYLLMDAP